MFNIFKKKNRTKELRLKAMLLNEENGHLKEEIEALSLNKKKIIDELIIQLSQTREDLKNIESQSKSKTDLCRILEDRINQLEQQIKENSNKIASLSKDNYDLSLLIPEKFPYKKIMDSCSSAAWYGGKTTRNFLSSDGKYKLIFDGVVYEPSWECFTAGCCVYAEENNERKTLYSIDSHNVAAYKNETVKVGSYENIENWLKEKGCGFKEI